MLNFICFSALSQNPIMIHQGEIEYEKRVNTHAIVNEYYLSNPSSGTQQYGQQYKANNPQFGVTTYTLTFNDDYSLYSPAKSTVDLTQKPLLTILNNVYLNLKNQKTITKKSLFGELYLVEDSIRQIKWRITGETREIAGFSCRRANAIIMDSIYVVAFYTDQIVPKAGPESFTGLPGMILGIALPSEHMTWFATRVTVNSTTGITTPSGGKKLSYGELRTLLLDDPSLKQDPKIGNLFLRNSLF